MPKPGSVLALDEDLAPAAGTVEEGEAGITLNTLAPKARLFPEEEGTLECIGTFCSARYLLPRRGGGLDTESKKIRVCSDAPVV